MSSSEFTKAERRELRELAGEVFEAEAHGYLEELDRDFTLWRKGKMLSSDLLTSIHQFHQHENRDLWKMYQGLDDDVMWREVCASGCSRSRGCLPSFWRRFANW